MQKITSIEQAETILAGYEQPVSTVAYTLETMNQLVEALGNPQNEIPIIHIAGTSGKTSTAYYCAALLKQAGLKVGLSVSPHIDSVTERTQINLNGLDESTYCQYLTEFIELVDRTRLSPSYFELLVAFSYWVFAVKEKVDAAVIEVGLGGLLDATNVVTRSDKICVITDIGYDHMNVLGSTIQEIAAQKAGIIQPGNQVIMHQQVDEVMTVIEEIAHSQQASMHVASSTTYANLPLFQQRNFSLSLTAIKLFMERAGKAVDDLAVQSAMQIVIPARMEVRNDGHKTIVFDGSHNDQKMTALIESLKDSYPGVAMTFVVAFGAHRRENAVEALRLIHQLSDDVIVTEFDNHQDSRQQSLSSDDLASIAEDAGFASVSRQNDPRKALDQALNHTSSMVVVTGSFYLLRYVR